MTVLEMTGQDSASSKFVCKCLFGSWLSIFSSILARQIFRYSIVKVQNHQPLSPKGTACALLRGFPADGWSGWDELECVAAAVGGQANPG